MIAMSTKTQVSEANQMIVRITSIARQCARPWAFPPVPKVIESHTGFSRAATRSEVQGGRVGYYAAAQRDVWCVTRDWLFARHGVAAYWGQST
jgi:hypothetical protein